MDWNIRPQGSGWRLRKNGSDKTVVEFKLRRDAIKEARHQASKTKGVIYVHNKAGDVIIRIPEIEMVAAAVWVKNASAMTPAGRKEIADWMRKRAADLVAHGKDYASNFRGRYYYS